MSMDSRGEAPRRSGDSSSPDFEFWMVGNPAAFPQSPLLTADELFVDGVLLPLRLLSIPPHSDDSPQPQPHPEPEPEPAPAPEREPASIASLSSCLAPTSASKRWRDIFKVGEKKTEEKDKPEKPKKERKNSAGAAAELNINIWPFARSRSAGTGAGPKPALSARKASSAPCSRSNSRGESSKHPASFAAPRRWAPSPGRAGLAGGVHVGRASPVWQLRRNGRGSESGERATISGGGGGRRAGGGIGGINLNVNTCIGYRSQLSCRRDDKDGLVGGGGGGDGGGAAGGSLFNLRSLFSKKVY